MPSRFETYRNDWDHAVKKDTITEFPLYLQLELTGRCNLKCPHCLHGTPAGKGYSVGTMDFDLYLTILMEAQKSAWACPSMAFHNSDEPLLHPDLVEFVQMAKNAGILDLILVTNATLFNRKVGKQLARAGITKFNFSLHRISEAWNNIKDFLNWMKKYDSPTLPKVRITRVKTIETQDWNFILANFWSGYKVEFQPFQLVSPFAADLIPLGAIPDPHFDCCAPWRQLMIRADGDVYPCCSFHAVPDLKIGNVKDCSLHTLWHGSKMSALRHNLGQGKFIGACARCKANTYVVPT